MEETNKEKTGEQEKFAAPGESSFDAAGEFNLPKTDAANQKDASANEPGPKPSRENQDSSPIYQQYIIENAQTINSSFGGAEEEKKKLSDISLDDLGAISPLSKKWFDIKTARDADLFEDNFQTLMKENICFITSQNPESRWALVYHIQKQASFLNKNCKEVFFPDNEEADYSNMLDLISSLKDQKELLLVANLTQYNKNKAQGKFLSSATWQKHNKSHQLIKQNNIYLLLLITKDTADGIVRNQNGMSQFIHIWEIFDTPKPEIDESSINELFYRLNPVEKAVLFAGVSFNNLSFRDFNYIVSLLLDNISENTPVIMDVYKDFPEGAKEVKQVLNENYQDIWLKHRDQFIRNCWLVGKNERGDYRVNLKYDDSRERIVSYLKEHQHFFWQQQCSFLEERRLIFNYSISKSLSQGVIDLVADALADDQHYYNDSWFLDILFDIQLHDGEDYIIRGETEKEKLVNLFADMSQREGFTRFFYSQLTYLLKRLVERNRLEHVDGLLECLINYGLHRQLLILVKGISTNDSFDTFYWIKQLIERAPSDIKNEAYIWLVYHIGFKKPAETINVIKTWLPADKPIQNFSPSNHYSCYFFVHFFIADILEMLPDELEQSNKVLSILRAGESVDAKPGELIRFVIKQFFTCGSRHQFAGGNAVLIPIMRGKLFCFPWVKNEPVRKFMGITDSSPEKYTVNREAEEYESLIADIIECWYYIITVQHELPANTRELLTAAVFETIFNEAESLTLKRLIGHWQLKPKLYQQELDKLKATLGTEQLSEAEKSALTRFAGMLQERHHQMAGFFDEINKYY